MKANCYGITDPGLKRSHNDDYYLMDEELGLFIVCDGVGGHAAGDVASETCARTVREVVNKNRAVIDRYKSEPTKANRAKVGELLMNALQEANRRILEQASRDASKHGMSTTAEVVLYLGDFGIIAHVGDSRTYLVRNGACFQLTEDHKVSTEMQKQGLWTAEEAARNPQSHVITRAVGIQPFLQVDLLQVEAASGDLFILCSDGLGDYLPKPARLADLVQQSELSRVPATLVKHAKDSGGHDNVTVVSLRIESDAPKQTSAIDALQKEEILGKVPLFRYLTYPELMKVLGLVKIQNYRKDAILVTEGEHSEEMFIIIAGKVAVKKNGQIIARREKGAVFGEMGIFDNAPRSATVFASETTQVMVISRKELLTLLRQDSQIAVKLLWALNQELNQLLRTTSKDLAEAKTQLESLRIGFLPETTPAPFAMPPESDRRP